MRKSTSGVVDTTGFTSPLAAGGTYTPLDMAPSGGAATAADTGTAGQHHQSQERGPADTATRRSGLSGTPGNPQSPAAAPPAREIGRAHV